MPLICSTKHASISLRASRSPFPLSSRSRSPSRSPTLPPRRLPTPPPNRSPKRQKSSFAYSKSFISSSQSQLLWQKRELSKEERGAFQQSLMECFTSLEPERNGEKSSANQFPMPEGRKCIWKVILWNFNIRCLKKNIFYVLRFIFHLLKDTITV